MITTTYDYSSGVGFVYDSGKIGFSGGAAKLLLVSEPGQTFVPTVSASTYNPAELEYVGGVLRQKDQRPANSTFYASWAAGLTANWGDGILTGTAFNGAAVTGGYLDLTGSVEGRYVEFSALANAASLQTGAVKFKVTPNYSGTPLTYQIFWTAFTTDGVSNNTVEVYHSITTGDLFIRIFSGTNTSIVNQDLGNWAPVSGTEYEFELDWDITGGATRLFIDGVQKGATATGTGTRTAPINLMRIGNEYTFTPTIIRPNFKIRQLINFSTVQHTANYTPGYSYSPTIYPDATANLPLFTYGGLGAVVGFTAFAEADSGAPHYTLNGNYWNGSAWVVSNGSYAQSNTTATVNTNIAAVPTSNTLQVNAIYQAQNSPQMSIGVMTVTYTSQAYPVDNPTISPNTPLTVDQVTAFADVHTASGSDTVKWYLMINSVAYWWNSTTWVVSNGTLAESNTAAEIQSNAGDLPITLGVYFTPYALLHSNNGSTTPTLTSLTLTYDYFGPTPTGPNVCTVFGYIVDETDTVVPNAVVKATNPTTFFNQGVIVAQGAFTATTNSLGYFSMTLVETATPVKKLTWTVKYPSSPRTAPPDFTFGKATIPDQPTANLTDLVFS